jgi:hypothetical protein
MVCDRLGRPLTFFLSPGQMSDAKGALALLDALPPATMLLADKGYDADWFREALEEKGFPPASRPGAGARTPPVMTGNSTSSVTGSKTCLPASRTGAASPPATTDAAICSSPPSVSPRPSYSEL